MKREEGVNTFQIKGGYTVSRYMVTDTDGVNTFQIKGGYTIEVCLVFIC